MFARSSCPRSIGSGAPLIFRSGAADLRLKSQCEPPITLPVVGRSNPSGRGSPFSTVVMELYRSGYIRALGAPTSRRDSLPSPAPTLDSSSLRFLLNSYVPSDRLFGVTKNLQCRTKGYGGPAGTVVRRPMDIVITSALVILIVGCVLGYSFRAEIARDRPAEPRRRRPF